MNFLGSKAKIMKHALEARFHSAEQDFPFACKYILCTWDRVSIASGNAEEKNPVILRDMENGAIGFSA